MTVHLPEQSERRDWNFNDDGEYVIFTETREAKKFAARVAAASDASQLKHLADEKDEAFVSAWIGFQCVGHAELQRALTEGNTPTPPPIVAEKPKAKKPAKKEEAAKQQSEDSEPVNPGRKIYPKSLGNFDSDDGIRKFRDWVGDDFYALTEAQMEFLPSLLAELQRDPDVKKKKPSAENRRKLGASQLPPKVLSWLLAKAYGFENTNDMAVAENLVAAELMKARFVFMPVGRLVYRTTDRRLMPQDDAIADFRKWSPGLKVEVIRHRLQTECPQADGVARLPGLPQRFSRNGRTLVNLWHPWPDAPATADLADVQVFLGHLLYILKTPENVERFLDWLAFLVQNPSRHNRWCFVLCSDHHQVGKGFIIHVVEEMFGAANCTRAGKRELNDGGNTYLERASFININEAMLPFSVVETLKECIGDERTPVRRLYSDTYTLEHAASFLICSNNPGCVAIDEFNTRFFIVHHEEERRPDAHYDGLKAWLADGGAGKLRAFLAARDLGKHNPDVIPELGDDALAMIEDVRGVDEADVLTLLRSGKAPFDRDIIELGKLHSVLRVKHGIEIKLPALQRALKAGGGVNLGQQRVRVVEKDGTIGAEAKVRLWAVRNVKAWKAVEGADAPLIRGYGLADGDDYESAVGAASKKLGRPARQRAARF